MPRSRSSGALSIWSYAVNVAPPDFARILVIAAVSDVLPWSTCPIVPTLQCGLSRLNFSLPMTVSVGSLTYAFSGSGELRLNFFCDRTRHFRVVIELHSERRATLRHRAQVRDVAEHIVERHHRGDDVGVAAHVLTLDLATPRVEIADNRAGVVFR